MTITKILHKECCLHLFCILADLYSELVAFYILTLRWASKRSPNLSIFYQYPNPLSIIAHFIPSCPFLLGLFTFHYGQPAYSHLATYPGYHSWAFSIIGSHKTCLYTNRFQTQFYLFWPEFYFSTLKLTVIINTKYLFILWFSFY